MELVLNIGQQSSKDWVDYFTALSPFIIGLITIIYTHININYSKKQMQQQKEQWLNDALIQNEYKILLKMKEVLSKTTNSVIWYFTFVLCDFVLDNDFTDENLLEPDDFIKQIKIHQLQLLKLYNLYRENYYIFEKYDIAKEVLRTCVRDIKYGLVPSNIMPESHDSISSGRLNTILQEKLKRILRKNKLNTLEIM